MTNKRFELEKVNADLVENKLKQTEEKLKKTEEKLKLTQNKLFDIPFDAYWIYKF